MIADYAASFNKHDLNAIAGFWTEQAIHIDRETGERTVGRDAVREDIKAALEVRPKTVLQGSVKQVRFIKPDVASVEGDVTVSSPDAGPTKNMFSAILIDRNGKWMIDSMEETPLPVPSSAQEALQELDWLVGRWIDSSEESQINTVIRWTEDKAFLLRSFLIETSEGGSQQGTQIIGWDPRSQEIRSWSFNSDGSFGDAIWTKNGDDWLIKSSQTLSDGQASSGTFVLTKVSDNEITLQLIGHEIEGEPQPTSMGVSVVRVVDNQPTTSSPSQQK
jgi:uncharacterized protein (TIGR02246 family)